MIFAQVLGHVCYKQATKWECALVYRRMCISTHTHTPPVQNAPPAVHFSLALWSLFISPCVPPSKPLFLLHSPFCYISCVSASLPHLCLCVWFSFSSHTELVIEYFIMSLWTKWNVALSLLLLLAPFFLFHHECWFYLLSPACNLAATPNPFFTAVIFCCIDGTAVLSLFCGVNFIW